LCAEKNELITSCFIACAFASIVAQDALNAFLESLAIIKVQSQEQVIINVIS
jgi:hypothetical protein